MKIKGPFQFSQNVFVCMLLDLKCEPTYVSASGYVTLEIISMSCKFLGFQLLQLNVLFQVLEHI